LPAIEKRGAGENRKETKEWSAVSALSDWVEIGILCVGYRLHIIDREVERGQ
jgi:hypothetical protein